jgi:hypothetical protein
MIICCEEVLFWSSLFDVLEAFCTRMGKSFLRFWKFSVIILLNTFQSFLVGPLLLLQCPYSQAWSFDNVGE